MPDLIKKEKELTDTGTGNAQAALAAATTAAASTINSSVLDAARSALEANRESMQAASDWASSDYSGDSSSSSDPFGDLNTDTDTTDLSDYDGSDYDGDYYDESNTPTVEEEKTEEPIPEVETTEPESKGKEQEQNARGEEDASAMGGKNVFKGPMEGEGSGVGEINTEQFGENKDQTFDQVKAEEAAKIQDEEDRRQALIAHQGDKGSIIYDPSFWTTDMSTPDSFHSADTGQDIARYYTPSTPTKEEEEGPVDATKGPTQGIDGGTEETEDQDNVEAIPETDTRTSTQIWLDAITPLLDQTYEFYNGIPLAYDSNGGVHYGKYTTPEEIEVTMNQLGNIVSDIQTIINYWDTDITEGWHEAKDADGNPLYAKEDFERWLNGDPASGTTGVMDLWTDMVDYASEMAKYDDVSFDDRTKQYETDITAATTTYENAEAALNEYDAAWAEQSGWLTDDVSIANFEMKYGKKEELEKARDEAKAEVKRITDAYEADKKFVDAENERRAMERAFLGNWSQEDWEIDKERYERALGIIEDDTAGKLDEAQANYTALESEVKKLGEELDAEQERVLIELGTEALNKHPWQNLTDEEWLDIIAQTEELTKDQTNAYLQKQKELGKAQEDLDFAKKHYAPVGETDSETLQKYLDHINEQIWGYEARAMSQEDLEKTAAQYASLQAGYGDPYGTGNMNQLERFVDIAMSVGLDTDLGKPGGRDKDNGLDAFESEIVFDQDKGKWVLAPYLVKDENGEWNYLTMQDTMKTYRQTGKDLGEYDSYDEAKAAQAELLANGASAGAYYTYWKRQSDSLQEQFDDIHAAAEEAANEASLYRRNDTSEEAEEARAKAESAKEKMLEIEDALAEAKKQLEQYSNFKQAIPEFSDEEKKKMAYFTKQAGIRANQEKVIDRINTVFSFGKDGTGLEQAIDAAKAVLGHSKEEYNKAFQEYKDGILGHKDGRYVKADGGAYDRESGDFIPDKQFDALITDGFLKQNPEYRDLGVLGEYDSALEAYRSEWLAAHGYSSERAFNIATFPTGDKQIEADFNKEHPEYLQAVREAKEEVAALKDLRGVKFSYNDGVFKFNDQSEYELDPDYNKKVEAGRDFANYILALNNEAMTTNTFYKTGNAGDKTTVTALAVNDVKKYISDSDIDPDEKERALAFIDKYIKTEDFLPNMNWSYDELKAFEYLIGNGNYEKALEYAKDQNRIYAGMEKAARTKAVMEYSQAMAAKMTKPDNLIDFVKGLGGTAASAVLTGIPSALALPQIMEAFDTWTATKRTGETPISSNLTISEAIQAWNSGIVEDLKDYWNIVIPFINQEVDLGDVYNAIQGSFQSAYVVGLGNAIGTPLAELFPPSVVSALGGADAVAELLASTYTSIAFGGASFTDAFTEAYERTGDITLSTEEALGIAACDGIFEALSLDMILQGPVDVKNIADWLASTFVGGVVEMSEERQTEYATQFIQQVMEAGRDKWSKDYNDLQKQMGLSPEMAEKLVREEMRADIKEAGLGGFLSGAFMSGTRATGALIQSGKDKKDGNSILDNNAAEGLMKSTGERLGLITGDTKTQTEQLTKEETAEENREPAPGEKAEEPKKPMTIPPAEGVTKPGSQTKAEGPVATTDTATGGSPVAMPAEQAPVTAEEQRVEEILKTAAEKNITAADAREIAKNPELRAAFQKITGVELKGTTKQMVEQIRQAGNARYGNGESAKVGTPAEGVTKPGATKAEGPAAVTDTGTGGSKVTIPSAEQVAAQKESTQKTVEEEEKKRAAEAKYNKHFEKNTELQQKQEELEKRLDEITGRDGTKDKAADDIIGYVKKNGKQVNTVLGQGEAYELLMSNGRVIHVEYSADDKRQQSPRVFIVNPGNTITGPNQSGAKGKEANYSSYAEYAAKFKTDMHSTETLEWLSKNHPEMLAELSKGHNNEVASLQKQLEQVRNEIKSNTDYLLNHKEDAPGASVSEESAEETESKEEAKEWDPAVVARQELEAATAEAEETRQSSEEAKAALIQFREESEAKAAERQKEIDQAKVEEAEKTRAIAEAEKQAREAKEEYNDVKEKLEEKKNDPAEKLNEAKIKGDYSQAGKDLTQAKYEEKKARSEYEKAKSSRDAAKNSSSKSKAKKDLSAARKALDKATNALTKAQEVFDSAKEAYNNYRNQVRQEQKDLETLEQKKKDTRQLAEDAKSARDDVRSRIASLEAEQRADQAKIKDLERAEREAVQKEKDAQERLEKAEKAAAKYSEDGKNRTASEQQKQNESAKGKYQTDGEARTAAEQKKQASEERQAQIQSGEEMQDRGEKTQPGAKEQEKSQTQEDTGENAEKKTLDEDSEVRDRIKELYDRIKKAWNERTQAVAEKGTELQEKIDGINNKVANGTATKSDLAKLDYYKRQQEANTAKTGDIARDLGEMMRLIRYSSPDIFNAIVLENADTMKKAKPQWFQYAMVSEMDKLFKNTGAMAYLYTKKQNPNSIVLSQIGTDLQTNYGVDAKTAEALQLNLSYIFQGDNMISPAGIRNFANGELFTDPATRRAVAAYVRNQVREVAPDLYNTIKDAELADVLGNTWAFFNNVAKTQAKGAKTQTSAQTPMPLKSKAENDNLNRLMQARLQNATTGNFRMGIPRAADTSMPGTKTENRSPAKTSAPTASPAGSGKTVVSSTRIPDSMKGLIGRQIKIGRKTYNIFAYINKRVAESGGKVSVDMAAEEFKLILEGSSQKSAISTVAKDHGLTTEKKGADKGKAKKATLEPGAAARTASDNDRVRFGPNYPWIVRKDYVADQIKQGVDAKTANANFDRMMERFANDPFHNGEAEYGKDQKQTQTPGKTTAKETTSEKNLRQTIQDLKNRRQALYNNEHAMRMKGGADYERFRNEIESIDEQIATYEDDLKKLRARHGGKQSGALHGGTSGRNNNANGRGSAGSVSQRQVGSDQKGKANGGGSSSQQRSSGTYIWNGKQSEVSYENGRVVYDSADPNADLNNLTSEERAVYDRAIQAGAERVLFIDAQNMYCGANKERSAGYFVELNGQKIIAVNSARDIRNGFHETTHALLSWLSNDERVKVLNDAMSSIFKGKQDLFLAAFDRYKEIYKDAYSGRSDFETRVLEEMLADLANDINRISFDNFAELNKAAVDYVNNAMLWQYAESDHSVPYSRYTTLTAEEQAGLKRRAPAKPVQTEQKTVEVSKKPAEEAPNNKKGKNKEKHKNSPTDTIHAPESNSEIVSRQEFVDRATKGLDPFDGIGKIPTMSVSDANKEFDFWMNQQFKAEDRGLNSLDEEYTPETTDPYNRFSVESLTNGMGFEALYQITGTDTNITMDDWVDDALRSNPNLDRGDLQNDFAELVDTGAVHLIGVAKRDWDGELKEVKPEEITGKDVKGTPLGQMVTYAKENGTIDGAEAERQYEFLADLIKLMFNYEDTDFVWRIVGSEMFAAIKNNSDPQYGKTIDFSTICKKTQAVIDALGKTMQKLGTGLSKEEIKFVYQITGAAGESTPCPVCYVFSRWMGLGSVLDNIKRYQDLYGTTNPNGQQQALDLVKYVQKAAEAKMKKKTDLTFGKAVNAAQADVKKLLEKAEDNLANYDAALKNPTAKKYEGILTDAAGNSLSRDYWAQQVADLVEEYDKFDAYKWAIKTRLVNAELLVKSSEDIATRLRNKYGVKGDTAEAVLENALASNNSDEDFADFVNELSDNLNDLSIVEESRLEKLREKYHLKKARTSLKGAITKAVKAGIDPTAAQQRYDQNLADYEAIVNDLGTEEYVFRKSYKDVPDEILFDLNKGEEFAKNYPESWTYRTTRGSGLGKAIMPYSDARVGETIQGVAINNAGKVKIGEANPFSDPSKKAEADKVLAEARRKMAAQNLIGGMRFQSTSDFRYEYASDYLMTFFEMQAMGANVQLYTKVLEAVDFFANVGCDVNLSVMPKDKGLGVLETEPSDWADRYDHYYTYENEKYTKVPKGTSAPEFVPGKYHAILYSDVTGVNGPAAIDYAQKYDNVQLIMVGISGDHINACLDSDDITFVIPFHGSGNSTRDIQQLMNLLHENIETKNITDFTDYQGDAKSKDANKQTEAASDLRYRIVTGALLDKDGEINLSDTDVNVLNSNTILRDLFRRFYLDATDENGNLDRKQIALNNQSNNIDLIDFSDTTDRAFANKYYLNGVNECYHNFLPSGATARQVFPYEYWDKSLKQSEAKGNGDAFQAYCKSLGLVPRFSGWKKGETYNAELDFTKNDNYWKLLIDRKMYDNRGNYRAQRKINLANVDVNADNGRFGFADLNPTYGEVNFGNGSEFANRVNPRTDGKDNSVISKINDPHKTDAIAEIATKGILDARAKASARTGAHPFANDVDIRDAMAAEDYVTAANMLVKDPGTKFVPENGTLVPVDNSGSSGMHSLESSAVDLGIQMARGYTSMDDFASFLQRHPEADFGKKMALDSSLDGKKGVNRVLKDFRKFISYLDYTSRDVLYRNFSSFYNATELHPKVDLFRTRYIMDMFYALEAELEPEYIGHLTYDDIEAYRPRFAEAISKISDRDETGKTRSDRDFLATLSEARKLFAEIPELDFITRLTNNLNDEVEQDRIRKELEDLISGISDRQALWEFAAYAKYCTPAFVKKKKGLIEKQKLAQRKFSNTIEKRRDQILAESGQSSRIGLEEREYTFQEIRNMFNTLNKDESIAALADKVFPVAQKLGLTIRGRKGDVFESNTHGHYYGSVVQYNINRFNDLGVTDQFKASTLLHEMIHACTAYAVDAETQGASYVRLDPNMKKAVKQIVSIWDQVSSDPELKGMYGATNANEMLAELSNPVFRDALEKKNLWTRIVDAIKQFFGIDTNNALDATAAALDYLLDNINYKGYLDYADYQNRAHREPGAITTRAVNSTLNAMNNEMFGSFSLDDVDIYNAQTTDSFTNSQDEEVTVGRFSLDPNDIASVTYFAGSGTLDYALRDRLFHLYAVEYDPDIRDMFLKNNGNAIMVTDADVNEVNPRSVIAGHVDYFHASPVCKNFSMANNKRGETEMDKQFARSIVKALYAWKPKVFTLENVAGYRNSESLAIIKEALRDIYGEEGVKWDIDVYNSADYGATTARRRLFVRAVLDGELPAKPQVTGSNTWWSVAEGFVNQAIEDGNVYSYEDGLTKSVKARLEKMKNLDPDNYYHLDVDNLTEPVLILSGTQGGLLSFATASKPSPTLTTKGGSARIIMPDKTVIKMSPEIYAAIQGLDKEFKFPMQKRNPEKIQRTKSFTIVGNGIPTQLTQAVVNPLLDTIDKSKGGQFSLDLDEEFENHTAQEVYDQLQEQDAIVSDLKSQADAMHDEYKSYEQQYRNHEITTDQFKDWIINSGYNDLVARRKEAEYQRGRLYSAYMTLRDRELEAEERADIENSGMSEAEYFQKKAIDTFGYTPYIIDAGFLLPNGKMLNFSGEKGKHYGQRGDDHRAIGQIFATTSLTDAMVRFMNYGNVRMIPESPGIDLGIVEPTTEQYNAIRNFVRWQHNGYFNVDFTDANGRSAGSIEYNGNINPSKVVNDIKTFYRTGEVPQQSLVDQFHGVFSLDSIPDAKADMGLNFRDPTGELLERVFDKNEDTRKKYETRSYTDKVGNGKLPAAYLNKTMGIVQTGDGPAKLVGYWELGDGELRNSEWLSKHAKELGNDGTEFEAKTGESKWVYPIKWAEQTKPRVLTSRGIRARSLGQFSLDIDEAYDEFGDEIQLDDYNLTDLTQSALSEKLYYSPDGNTAYYQTPTGETVVLENIGPDSPEARYINYLEANENANDTYTTTAEPHPIPFANRYESDGYNLREQDVGLRPGPQEVLTKNQERAFRSAGSNGELYEQSESQSSQSESLNGLYSLIFGEDEENNKGDQNFKIYNENGDTVTTFDTYPIDSFEQHVLLNLRSGNIYNMEEMINEYVEGHGRLDPQSFENVREAIDRMDDLTEEKKQALHKAIDKAIKKYGALPKGKGDKKPNVLLPKKVTDKKGKERNTRKFIQTAASNVENEHLTDRMLYEGMTNELLGYTPQSNATSIRKAWSIINNNFGGDLYKAAEGFALKVQSGELPRAEDIAMAEILIQEFSADPMSYDQAIKVAADLSIMGTSLGQAVQAMAIIKKATPQGQLYYLNGVVNHLNAMFDKRINNPTDKMNRIVIDQTLAAQLMAASTRDEINDAVEAIKDDIAAQIPANFWDKWNAWRYLAMLGNPRTHIRNILGNALFMPAVFVKDMVARRIEQIPGLVSDENRLHSKDADLRGWLFNKADNPYMQFAYRDYETMKELIGGKKTGNKFSDANDIMSRRRIFDNDFLNAYEKGNSELLSVEDLKFQQRYYARYLAEALQAKGITVDQLEALEGAENGENVINAEMKAMLNQARQYAMLQAQRNTYHELNTFSLALNKMKAGGPIQNVLLEGLMPFVGTPSNIFVLGAIKYSPYTLVKSMIDLRNELQNGGENTMQIIDDMAAGLTGTGIMVLGALLAAAGLLRGAGPSDDDKNKLEKLQGHQAWSIEFPLVGGKKASYTIDWMAPMAMPLFVGSTFWELISGELDLSDPAALWQALMGLADPLLSMSMLDGLESTLSSISSARGENSLSTLAAAMAMSYFAQGVPTIGGQIARTLDPTRRATYIDKNSPIPGAIQRFVQNSIQAKIPGWASQKMAYVDAWGRTDTQDNIILRALENFISPGYANIIETTPVDEEIMRLYEAVGDELTLPDQLTKYLTIDGERKDFTAEEFEQLMKTAGGEAYDIIFNMITDARYNAIDDDMEKAALINNALQYAKDYGKHEVYNDYAMSNTEQTAKAVGPADYYLTKGELPKNYTNEDLFMMLATNPYLTTTQVADMVSAEFTPPRELYSDSYTGYLYELTDEDKAAMRDLFNEEIRDEMYKMENDPDYINADAREKGYLIEDAYNRARESTKTKYSQVLDGSGRDMELGRASAVGKEKWGVAINATEKTLAEQAKYLSDNYTPDHKIDNPDHLGWVINLSDEQYRHMKEEFAEQWEKDYEAVINSEAYRTAETEEIRENYVAAAFNKTAKTVEEAYARELNAQGHSGGLRPGSDFANEADRVGEYVYNEDEEELDEELSDVKAGWKWTQVYQIALENFDTIEEMAAWMSGKMTGATSVDNPNQVGHKMGLDSAQKSQEALHEQQRFYDAAIQVMSDPNFQKLTFDEKAGALHDLEVAVAKYEEGKYAQWLLDNGMSYEDKRDISGSTNAVFFTMLMSDDLTKDEFLDILDQRYTSKVGSTIKNNSLSYVEKAHRVDAYMQYISDNFEKFTSTYLTSDEEAALLKAATVFENSYHKSAMSQSGNVTARDFGITQKVTQAQNRENKKNPNWSFNRWMSKPVDFDRDVTPFIIPPAKK